MLSLAAGRVPWLAFNGSRMNSPHFPICHDEIGVRGWHEGPSPVPDAKAMRFLQLLGILPR